MYSDYLPFKPVWTDKYLKFAFVKSLTVTLTKIIITQIFQIILRVAKTKKEEGLGSLLICQLITLKYNVGYIIGVLKTC